MNNISKYLIICLDQGILDMDKNVDHESDEIDDDESDDEIDESNDEIDDEDDDEIDESDDEIDKDTFEIDTDAMKDDFDRAESESLEDNESEYYEPESSEEIESEEIIAEDSAETEYELAETEYDEISDCADPLYAYSAIDDEDIIDSICNNNTFAFSTKSNKSVASQNTDFITIAKLSDLGMDRIFVYGKEVFVHGLNKISLKTDKNMNKIISDLRNRGLDSFADRISYLQNRTSH